MGDLDDDYAAPAPGDENHHNMLMLTRAIGRVEGKLDGFLDKMESQDKRITDIDGRMRTVENHQYKIAGASGVLGLVAGAVSAFATHFLKS